MRAAEWFVHSVGFFMLLQSKHSMLKTWSHNGSNWIVNLKCGFFHAPSFEALYVENLKSQWEQLNGLSTCGFFHASSTEVLYVENLKSQWEQLKCSSKDWVFSRSFIWDTVCWKLEVTMGAAELLIYSVGFFMLLHLRHFTLKTWSHNGSSWIFHLQCGFFHAPSFEALYVENLKSQ